jgi:hypothetical protein
MIYTIRKTFKYTEIVEVQAICRSEALELANITEGDTQNDDWLYDAEIIYEWEARE